MKTSSKLPSNFHRSLSVTAQTVENTLDELESMLRGRDVDKLTTRVTRSLTAAHRQKLLDAIEGIRGANGEMFHSFDLMRFERDEERIVRAAAGHLWVILSDSTARGMRGFGKLSPDQASEVDSYVHRLLTLLKQLH